MNESDRGLNLLLTAAWFALPVIVLVSQLVIRILFERAARRLGLSVTEVARTLQLSGTRQDVAIEITQYTHGEGKAPRSYEVVARARVPLSARWAPPEAPRLEPVTIADGWVEHRRSGRLRRRELEPLLDMLTRSAQRVAFERARSGSGSSA